MPPKPKFSKEEVAAAALSIVKEKGVAALTAREVGKRLGTSPTPIFTVFKNMEEVKREARKLALKEFETYAGDYAEYFPSFKRIGMLMIEFAVSEPELFKLVFIQEQTGHQSFSSLISDLGSLAETCIALIMRENEITRDEASVLFNNMWIFAFGIGTLCANQTCDFSEDQIAESLGQMFSGMMMLIKSGNLGKTFGVPLNRSDKNAMKNASAERSNIGGTYEEYY